MSLILDALNKADKENHHPESSPSIDTEHELPEDLEPLRSPKMKRILVSIAMFLIVAVLIWSIFLRPQDESITDKTEFVQSASSNAKLKSKQQENLQKKASSNTQVSVPPSSKSTKNSRKEELQNRLIEAQYKEEQERLRLKAQKPENNTSPNKQDIKGLYNGKSNETAEIASATQTVANQTEKNREIQNNIAEDTFDDKESKLLNEARVELMRLEALESNADERINQVINDELLAMAKEKAANGAPKAEQIIEAPNSATPVATKPKPSTETRSANDDDDTTLAFYKDIGSIRELPISAQEAIPTMMYTQHNYSAGQKSIEINGKKVRENSRISGDVKVDKILKDGAIMRYQKYTFKMSAYNNWINF